MKEEWREINGYEGVYDISNFGRVKGVERYVRNGKSPTALRLIKEKILVESVSKRGYMVVTLSKDQIPKTAFVHRLVADAFIPNSNEKPQVNHIDGNKHNNYVTNLEWCSDLENLDHAFHNGLRDRRATRAVIQISTETGKELKEFQSMADAAKEVGLKSGDSIWACCNGKRKTSGGFAWKYKD